MTMPNFLIIGAAKSGTTALWNQLQGHPQVYLSPIKHTRFFALEGEDVNFDGPPPRDARMPWARGTRMPYAVTDLGAYRELFSGVANERAVGEASHSYLYSPRAPERIKHYVSHAKLIAVLRDPVERAYSHFWQMIRDGREPLTDFYRAIQEEDARIRDNWWPDFHYKRLGFYYAQLKHYYDLFERDQIRVYYYEDLNTDPSGVLRDLFQFLEVDPTVTMDTSVRYNVSGVPKSKIVHRIFLELSLARPFIEPWLSEKQRQRVLRTAAGLKRRNLVKPPVSPQVRSRLIEEYRDDILRLQDLTQRDLSAWLK